MMETLFQWCVAVLYDASAYLGCTYEEINIYLFIIIHPLITLYFIAKYIKEYQLRKMAEDIIVLKELELEDAKRDAIDGYIESLKEQLM